MVYVRTDANSTIATGHMMRCITVSKKMRERGQNVVFLVSDENSVFLLKDSEFDYIVLNTCWKCLGSADEIRKMKSILINEYDKSFNKPLLIVDSYYVDNSYFNQLKDYSRIAYFDDLANEVYNVDYLINYNIFSNTIDYENMYMTKKTKCFIGPKYTPLREQFSFDVSRCFFIPSDEKRLSVLLTCGGGDNINILENFINAILDRDNRFVNFIIVIGLYNNNYRKLQKIIQRNQNISLMYNVKDMADVMKCCDLAISSAGTVLYECASTGLPTIFFSLADNQLLDAECFGNIPGMYYIGDIREKKEEKISTILSIMDDLINNPNERMEMSMNMRRIIDGDGANRIANALCRLEER